MAKYRNALPQLSDKVFLTDGGIETTLIFHEGIDLPHFAAFDLLKDSVGTQKLQNYYLPYIDIARRNGAGFILESATWRASADWGRLLGYARCDLVRFNRKAIEILAGLRAQHETDASPMVISGCIGPRGDGYNPDALMTADQSQAYHTEQIATFAKTETDMATAITMTHVGEATGIVRASQEHDLPVVIGFTVETDGRLPTGQALGDAIDEVDAETGGGPAYYMINCAHPTHFDDAIARGEHWVSRIRGLRANASCASHAELDEAEELDEGNPRELGGQYRQLRSVMGNVNVMGGCCGTDHRHVEEIALACAA